MEPANVMHYHPHRTKARLGKLIALGTYIHKFIWIELLVILILLFSLPVHAGGLFGDVFREIGNASGINEFQDLADSMDNAHRGIKKAIRPYGDAEEFVSKNVNKFSKEIAGELGGKALAQWIRASKDDAIDAGVSRIPKEVRAQLLIYFQAGLIDKIRYRVGQGNEISLAANSFRFGDRDAITLDDVIVFRRSTDTRSLGLWAHEIGHVIQYNKWEIEGFAKRYVKAFRSLEAEADSISRRFVAAYNVRTRDSRFGYSGNTARNFYIGGCNIKGNRVLVDKNERVYPYGVIRAPRHRQCAFDLIGRNGGYCVNRVDGAVLKFAPRRGWYKVGQCYGFSR